jgi:hypothetical protein
MKINIFGWGAAHNLISTWKKIKNYFTQWKNRISSKHTAILLASEDSPSERGDIGVS